MAQQRYSDQQMEAEIKEGRGRQSVEAVLVRSHSKKLHVPITGVQLTFSTVSLNSTSRETNLKRLGNQQTLNKEVRVSHFRDKIVRKVPSGRQHRAVCAEHGRHTFKHKLPKSEAFGRNLVATVPAVRMCKNSAGRDAK